MHGYEQGDQVYFRATVGSISLLTKEIFLHVPCEPSDKHTIVDHEGKTVCVVRALSTAQLFGEKNLLLPNRDNLAKSLGDPCFIGGQIIGTRKDTLIVNFPGTPAVEIRANMVPTPEEIEITMAKVRIVRSYVVTESDLVSAAQKRLNVDPWDDPLIREAMKKFPGSETDRAIENEIHEKVDAFCGIYCAEREEEIERTYEQHRMGIHPVIFRSVLRSAWPTYMIESFFMPFDIRELALPMEMPRVATVFLRKNLAHFVYDTLRLLEKNPASLPDTQMILNGRTVPGLSVDDFLQIKYFGDAAKMLAKKS